MPIDLTRLAPTRFTTMPIILPNCSCRCLATTEAADELRAWPSATPAERPARAQGNVGLPTNQLRFLKNRLASPYPPLRGYACAKWNQTMAHRWDWDSCLTNEDAWRRRNASR